MLNCQFNLNNFKDIHDGTCFIIGTGPSINEQNLSLIEGKSIIGVNSFYNHFLKCSYMVVSDNSVWDLHKYGILNRCRADKNYVFLCTPYPDKNFRVVNCRVKQRDLSDNYDPDWYDATKGIYRSGTVIIAALQLAFFMGFKKVFLLGCDCHYSQQEHFDNTSVAGIRKTNWDRVFRQYECVKSYYENYNRQILNCTYKGKLEVFPRISLQNAINSI